MCWKVVLQLSILLIAQSAVILRVRLPNGLFQRLEVDEEKESISDLRNRLISEGILSEENISFVLKDQIYSAKSVSASIDDERITIKNLGISSGDILSINRPASKKAVSKPTVTSPKTGGKKVIKKNPSSIADLEKKRKEMIKIIRQKGSNNRLVSMTSSAGRILNRLAENGGYALLLGKNVPIIPEKNTKKGNSISAITKSDNAVKERIEVHAICEIHQFLSNGEISVNFLPENLSDIPAVTVFTEIAKALGLSVVGCCVGSPEQQKDGKSTMWSSDHLFAALQLRSSTATEEELKSFVVISVCKAISQEATEIKKKIPKHKIKTLVADGISIEAFQLSDQANILYEKGILPLIKTKGSNKKSSFSSFSTKASAMKSLAMKASGSKIKTNEIKDELDDNIQLTGEVLIQSKEMTSIDPFLFAVPLPISPLKRVKKAGVKITKKNVNEIDIKEFEHSFPSECEMQSDENTAKLAKLHFNRILNELLSDTIKDRMRDPHLLSYMFKILDEPTRNALSRSLMDGSNQFPGLVKVALEMVKLSLDSSRSNSNSRGSRSGRFIPDEEDDE